MAQEIAQKIAQRRRRRGQGVLSDLTEAEIDGERLSDEELSGIVMPLLLGGMDTTAGRTGNAFLRIDADPALRRRLLEDPAVLEIATEEFLRRDTPVQGLTRVVTRDAQFHGRQLKKGDRVMLMFAAANRDPSTFACPHDIDLDCGTNRHLAFAPVVHRCLGSNFARAMFRVMITALLRRLPDGHVAPPVERLADAGDVYTVKHLPVRLTPGPREGVGPPACASRTA
ncbi:cytochrome P450 [Frankia alni]|uniref:cytochrome P450 n=1 Tax=unclassified Frankia TaxID=2632575 RepID=UPI001E36FAA4